MGALQLLACLWTLLVIPTGSVHSNIQFFERQAGESVDLHCSMDQRHKEPFGVYLKRSWLHPTEVLFMHTMTEFSMHNNQDRSRTSVHGDPRNRSLDVTISELKVSDTDRYYCEFVVANPSSEDERIPATSEFFLLVSNDAPGSFDVGRLDVCAGGSAVVPCLPPHGESVAVEGVSLKRQRGPAPVELLYHSKRHHSSRPRSSSQSQFPDEKVQLSWAPGPAGITCNLSLQQLQPEDSGLYSCQLLLRGRPDSITSLGRQVFYVSVQGGQCGCSSYSTLLYALTSAVVILFLLLGLVLIYQNLRHSGRSHPQAPIYEEMTGVLPLKQKLGPRHLEETESSEYFNCHKKKSCPENHYESPIGTRGARSVPKISQEESHVPQE
ncbi:cd7 antigen-like [Aulostomus maculatus]